MADSDPGDVMKELGKLRQDVAEVRGLARDARDGAVWACGFLSFFLFLGGGCNLESKLNKANSRLADLKSDQAQLLSLVGKIVADKK